MKLHSLTILLLLLFASCSKDLDIIPSDYYNIPSNIDNIINPNHPKSEIFQALLNQLVSDGVPGALMLVKTPSEGVWAGSSGLADIGSAVDMRTNCISRIGSITKTFVAVSILKLYEEGKLNLDEKANKYILSELCDKIENANDVTIRQLLNHTSGIYNYDDGIDCELEYFNNPDKEWTWQEALEYVYGKKANFKPGDDWSYSNTNYILLSLIIDKVEGKNHSQVIKESILTPLNMTATFYNPDIPIPRGTVRGYWDIHNDGRLTDATEIHYSHRLAEGGMVSSLYDMMTFTEALFTGHLLNDTTFIEMTDWKTWTGEAYYSMDGYGLGIQKWNSDYGEYWGHGGAVLGYKAKMYFFPESETIFILMINGSEGKVSRALNNFLPIGNKKCEIFDAIFN